MVEALPNTCKVLGSNPNNGERERKKIEPSPPQVCTQKTTNGDIRHSVRQVLGRENRHSVCVCVAGQDADI